MIAKYIDCRTVHGWCYRSFNNTSRISLLNETIRTGLQEDSVTGIGIGSNKLIVQITKKW